MGHAPMSVLRRFMIFQNKSRFNIDKCDICPSARQTRVPFPLSVTKSSRLSELLHMDVWGFYKTTTYDGMQYFLTIVDDCSRWTWVFFMRVKSNVVFLLKNFIDMVHTQFNKRVQVFRSYNGSEFVNQHCANLFQ